MNSQLRGVARYTFGWAVVLSLLTLQACARSSAETRVRTPLDSLMTTLVNPLITMQESRGEDFRPEDLTFCADPAGQLVEARAQKCLPCRSAAYTPSPAAALQHARRLRDLVTATPSALNQSLEKCVEDAYKIAIRDAPHDQALRTEIATFQLMRYDLSRRAGGVGTFDYLVDSLLERGTRGDSAAAARLVNELGIVIWTRADRMLAIPPSMRESKAETQLRAFLLPDGPPLRRLAPPVQTSMRSGESEAAWSHTLFMYAAQIGASDPAARSRSLRLAFGTLVARGQWETLGAEADRVLRDHPQDSVALIARALVAFHGVRDPVRDYPAVEAAFNRALRAMPKADSAAYVEFHAILSEEDRSWRSEYRIDERVDLDERSWSLVDPLWLTPVNEVQLTRHARMADADIRYAFLTKEGEAASRTPLGEMLLKRGVPTPVWSYRRLSPGFHEVKREWAGEMSTTQEFAGYDQFPRAVFYSDLLSLAHRVTMPLERSAMCSGLVADATLHKCVLKDNAYLKDVPFIVAMDTVDVTSARFRGAGDTIDMYFGARMPLRKFWHRSHMRTRDGDSLRYGLTVRTAVGDLLDQQVTTKALPSSGEVAWTDQWFTRAPAQAVMHRVEMFHPRQQISSTGSRLLTAAGEAFFASSGFGLSDILIASSVVPSTRLLRTWRDLRVVPNGGVVPPRTFVALAWEVYDLTPGPNGLANWKVTISREDGMPMNDEDVRSVIVGAPGAGQTVVANEPDASLISYRRQEPYRNRIVEFIRFNVSDARPGRHVFVIRVEDAVSGHVSTRTASFRVLTQYAQQR